MPGKGAEGPGMVQEVTIFTLRTCHTVSQTYLAPCLFQISMCSSALDLVVKVPLRLPQRAQTTPAFGLRVVTSGSLDSVNS